MNDNANERPQRRKSGPARFQRGRAKPSASPGGLRADGLQVIYGIHSVREALANPARRISRLIATENGAQRLVEDGPIGVEPVIVRPDDIGRQLTPDSVHQGVLLLAEPLSSPDIADLADDAVVVVLDQVTDPHNVGAIMRSAAAFGVAAIVTTQRHSPEITGIVAKAASGALEHVPLVHVGNLARGISALQERGFLCVGLDSDGDIDLADAPLRRPLALVMGAEGKGLRQLTRTTCDLVARVSLPGKIRSLNVSNAAAVALYAIQRALG